MANVFFKRGSQTALNTLIDQVKSNSATFVDGSFYLTTDTDRLYVAQSSTELVELNKSITTIESISQLPTRNDSATAPVAVGQFYYISGTTGSGANNTHGGNILVVCTSIGQGNEVHWTQVNPDTDHYIVNSTTATQVSVNSTSGIATIVTQVSDKIDTTGGTTHTAKGTFDIVAGSNVTVTQGTGRTAGGVKVPQVNIAAKDTTYTMSAPTGQAANTSIVRLTDNLKGAGESGKNQDITLKGTGGVTVSTTSNSTILISGSNPVSGVANSFGSGSATGQLTTTISISGSNNIVSTPITPTIKYGDDGTTAKTAVFDGTNSNTPTATLDVYTKSQVDSLISNNLQTADAMTYKGTVSSSDVNSKLGVAGSTAGTYKGNVGDTYKATNEITVPGGGTAKVGDLIIAEGVDGAVTWSVVPSGNDQFVTASVDGSTKALILKDTLKGSNLASLVFQNDNTTGNSIIDVVVTANTANNSLIVTPKHGPAGTGTAVAVANATATAAHTQGSSAFVVPIVTGISKDVHGHITSVTLDNYSFTHSKIDSVTHSFQRDTATSAHLGTFGTNVTVDGTGKTGLFKYSSETLSFTETSTSSTSGTIPGMNVELVWGSF